MIIRDDKGGFSVDGKCLHGFDKQIDGAAVEERRILKCEGDGIDFLGHDFVDLGPKLLQLLYLVQGSGDGEQGMPPLQLPLDLTSGRSLLDGRDMAARTGIFSGQGPGIDLAASPALVEADCWESVFISQWDTPSRGLDYTLPQVEKPSFGLTSALFRV